MSDQQRSGGFTRRTVLRTTSAGLLAASGASRLGRSARAAQDAATDGLIPSPGPDVPAAYFKFPAPFKSVPEPPGRGGSFSSLLISYTPPPVQHDDNQYWQAMEQALGVESWEADLVGNNDYATKIGTVLAGGDLPDIAFLHPQFSPSILQAIQQGAFTDLTPHLTGDALQQYPNLAKFPGYSWQGATLQGTLYGLPHPIPKTNVTFSYRRDLAAQVGIPAPENMDQFFELLTALTTADQYALAGTEYHYNLFHFMFRVPNNWRRNDDGTLIKDVETEEWRQSIEFTRRVFDAGLFHPNAQTGQWTDWEAAFIAGEAAAFGAHGVVGVQSYRERVRVQVGPEADVYALVPPGHDGGPGLTYADAGTFGFFAVPAQVGQDEDRLRELLRICDFFAAPFGSEEFILKEYGVEGHDFERDENGNPVRTARGEAEIGDLTRLAKNETNIFHPVEEEARTWQSAIADLAAVGIGDPTLNIYSESQVDKGAELEQYIKDNFYNFVYGRRSLDEIDDFVAGWRDRGGDPVREELQEALAGA